MSKVSIIIPSYNHSEFLFVRLESILNQTYKNWEAIIIDDKSTDNSVEIISDFLHKNPDFKVKHFIINKKNSGSGYFSWQKGIELADTKYIWIAETDDYSEPHFLEEMITILESNHNIALAFCNSNYVDKNNENLYDSSARTSILMVDIETYKKINGKFLQNSMPFNPLIVNGSSVVFRKPDIILPSIIFQQKQISDLFLWTYLVENKDFAFLNKNLNFFRRHEGSTTTKNQLLNKGKLFEEKVLYSNYFKLPRDKSKILILHFAETFFFFKKGNHSLLKKCFRGLENLNQLEVEYFYVKSNCQIFIKKIIKSACRLFQ
jgi:glycosyltransferase involved in cell wall biosynthesis